MTEDAQDIVIKRESAAATKAGAVAPEPVEPPLRERPEDILLLAGHFLKHYSDKYMRPLRPLPPEVETTLLEYHWPGNIRQLENVIKRLIILPSIEMALEELYTPLHFQGRSCNPEPVVLQPTLARRTAICEEHVSLKRASALAAERAEREIIMQTLEKLNWNRKKAACELSSSDKARVNRLRRWGGGGRSTAPAYLNGDGGERLEDHKMESKYHEEPEEYAVRSQR